ncbi:cytochrome-c peroxidase [Zhouia amylolytica]|uniref:Methylamine utilization protein MauG n=1 Tax=Zhouia amylolytica AD3 TaxID=1286632 RepID=W2ULJ4_9FLAO|nr:cytochrome c peroxidase [Zhouia amylolytica]ETN94839.1 Di-heme cytochrome c peroxidase family protein [Zhouia amylolytica AD3]
MDIKKIVLRGVIFMTFVCTLWGLVSLGIKDSAYYKVPQLNCDCPPGFKLNENNECIAQNLYMAYTTENDHGVGGLKTALPKVRDGFSPQQIDLGRYLFFDPALSKDGTISCATCHDPEKGFSDGLAASVGMNGYQLTRSAPSLWNVAYLKLFFWDGRAKSLEEQMKGPLFSKEEMNNTPDNLLNTLNNIDNYKVLFEEAFPNRNNNTITLEEIYTAITAFESSLISLNSRYDQYAHGYHKALNEKEIEGLNVFRSFVARCAECHTPPLFTNQQIAVLGVPEPDGKPLDPGAEIPYNDKTMRGGFKVPSLRNIEKTAPYMHAGNFNTLRETVQFYTDGRGHAVPENEELRIHWHIWEPELSDDELDRLVDFLKTLTDETFMPEVPTELPSGLSNTNHNS